MDALANWIFSANSGSILLFGIISLLVIMIIALAIVYLLITDHTNYFYGDGE